MRLKAILYGLSVATAVASYQGTADQPQVDYSRVPVLFVHGSGLTSETWQPMIDYLAASGYPNTYLLAVDLLPRDGANKRAAAEFIEPAVDRLIEQARAAGHKANYAGQPPSRVAVVAHSMGAVSSRWYAAKIAPQKVQTWIGIAGSNHGTDALCGYSGAGNHEMCPAFARSGRQSPMQAELNGTTKKPADVTPYGLGDDKAGVERVPPDAEREIAYFTIRIEPDEWIKPERSAVLDGAGGARVHMHDDVPLVETSAGNYLFQGDSDHDSLPAHPQIVQAVETLLNAARQ